MRRIWLLVTSSLLCLLVVGTGSGTASVVAHAALPSQALGATATARRAEPAGRIAFSADGSIYTVNVDGSGLQKIVNGNNAPQQTNELRMRQPEWAASPAFSPDGTQIAFVRDLHVWLGNADGTGQRLLGDVADGPPAGCAGWSACTPLGAANVAWSPDGSQVAVMLERAGGSGVSGVGMVDVATGSVRRLHGVMADSGAFMALSWLPDGTLSLSPSTGMAVRIDPVSGNELPPITLAKSAPWPATLDETTGGEWLAGALSNEQAVLYGTAGAMAEIAHGVSPAISPDKAWVAYFQNDTIRLVRTDGTGDREVLDLAPLGGRDRHFASTPDCYPDRNDSCSYRPPMLSWAALDVSN